MNRMKLLEVSRTAAWTITVLFVLFSTTSVRGQEADDPHTTAGAEPTELADTAKETPDEADDEKKEENSFPFIPIPIFISEPAIGYGLGAAVGYFHPREGAADETESVSPAITTGTPPRNASDNESKPPPVITGIAGAYTDNGTWGAGIGHMNNWKQDGIRYSGALGYFNIESAFYFLNRPFDFNLEGWFTIQDLKFRIARGNFFVGFKWLYLDATGEFKIGEDLPVELPGFSRADSGLAIQASWDTRDNTMTPDRGQLFQLETWRYDEAIGGDYDYWKVSFKANSFHPFAKRFVLGLRFDADAVDGDPPLWGYPWLTLRGIPALRYQNEKIGVIESELRWNIFDRWAVLGFVGAGATRGDKVIYQDESGIVAGGIGGRWLFRPQDKLWVGVDVARGPEDTYGYIQVGHAW